MKLRLVLCLSLVSLFACSKAPEPANPPTAPVSAATPAAPAPAATVATEAPAPTPTPAPPTQATPPAGPAPVEGTDYLVIADGKPWQPVAGKIEVVEFFNYVCPGCNAFNPLLEQWKAKQLADVNLVYVPADFRPDFVPYARAYFAAEALGLVGKTHQAVYRAIHETHSIPAEGDVPSDAAIAKFYSQYGVSAEMFEGAMRSFATDTRLRAAREFMMKSQATSTPSLLVNGVYLVKGRNYEDRLRIADHLIARERAKAR